MDGDKKVVLLSLLVMFLTLFFIYVLYFNVKTDNEKIVPKSEQPIEKITPIENKPSLDNKIDKNLQLETGNKEFDITNNKELNQFDKEIKNELAKVEKNISTEIKPQDIKAKPLEINPKKEIKPKLIILSGTKLRTGNLDTFKLLNIFPKYILEGKYNIKIGYLGKDYINISRKVEELGGNCIEINKKKDIINNQLVGDTIWFVNLPVYKSKFVIFMVYFAKYKDYWLVQINYPDYYQSKKYLQKIMK